MDQRHGLFAALVRARSTGAFCMCGVAMVLAALTPAGPTADADDDATSRARATAPATTSGASVVFTQVPIRAAAETPAVPAVGSSPRAGSRIVSLDPSVPDGAPINLTRTFHAAGRPMVSFDGQRILFVGRRAAADASDVWEMSAAGDAPRQITADVGNCCAAVYLSTIYTIDAGEPVRHIAFCSDAGVGNGHALYTCRPDGTRVTRITFNPYGATDPCPLGDGRLLFSGGQPPRPEHRDAPGSALFTVNTDGTDVFVFADAHGPPAVRGMPCETRDGRVVYVESTPGGRDRGGALVAVSRTASLRSRTVVAADPAGLYRSPSALGDGTLLVSYLPRGGGSWGVHVLDIASGTRIATVHDAPQWDELDASVIRARTEPPGRSSVVDDRFETGLLYCLNAYLSGTEESPGAGDGRIERLDVFTVAGDDGGRRDELAPGPPVIEELLGTVPVESDGSFHLRIPAGVPLRLRTLDSEGQVVQAMRSWFWVMPREVRGCIGCHEDRELSPPNRHALALRRAPRSVGVVGDDAVPAPGRGKGDRE